VVITARLGASVRRSMFELMFVRVYLLLSVLASAQLTLVL
jgi:hypothetical protein